MIRLAEPNVQMLLETLDSAIEDCRNGRVTPPLDIHNRVKLLYTWQDVAGRTEKVYHKVHGLLVPSTGERLMQHYRLGPVAGVVFVTLIALVTMWHLLVCLWRPANAIERVPSTAQTMPLHEARTRQRL